MSKTMFSWAWVRAYVHVLRTLRNCYSRQRETSHDAFWCTSRQEIRGITVTFFCPLWLLFCYIECLYMIGYEMKARSSWPAASPFSVVFFRVSCSKRYRTIDDRRHHQPVQCGLRADWNARPPTCTRTVTDPPPIVLTIYFNNRNDTMDTIKWHKSIL